MPDTTDLTTRQKLRVEHAKRQSKILATAARELQAVWSDLANIVSATPIERYATRSQGFDAIQAIQKLYHELLLESSANDDEIRALTQDEAHGPGYATPNTQTD